MSVSSVIMRRMIILSRARKKKVVVVVVMNIDYKKTLRQCAERFFNQCELAL